MPYNFNAPPKIVLERLSICKKCKFHKVNNIAGREFISCGTYIVAGLQGKVENDADPNQVRHYRNKIRLCGCDMNLKTKLSFASCPAGKWDKYRLNDEQLENLKQFIASIDGKSTLTSEQVTELYGHASAITGKYERPTTCGACVRELLAEMRKQVEKL